MSGNLEESHPHEDTVMAPVTTLNDDNLGIPPSKPDMPSESTTHDRPPIPTMHIDATGEVEPPSVPERASGSTGMADSVLQSISQETRSPERASSSAGPVAPTPPSISQ